MSHPSPTPARPSAHGSITAPPLFLIAPHIRRQASFFPHSCLSLSLCLAPSLTHTQAHTHILYDVSTITPIISKSIILRPRHLYRIHCSLRPCMHARVREYIALGRLARSILSTLSCYPLAASGTGEGDVRGRAWRAMGRDSGSQSAVGNCL